MQYASISARRLNRDPAPWSAPDGTRHAAPSAWVPSAEHADLDAFAALDYAPRHDFTPRQHLATNPLLNLARDAFGDSDPWGTAIGWAFAANAVLQYLGEPIAAERGYRASVAGAAGDLTDGSWEGAETISALGLGVVVSPDDVPARIAALRAQWADATGENPDDFALSGDDWAVGLGDTGAAEMVALLAAADGEGAVYLIDPADVDAATWLDAADFAQHAARVWDRYLSACRSAGLDY